MNVKELKERLNKIPDDYTVTVDLAPSGHVASGTVEVTEAQEGFDWTNNQFVLHTRIPVDVWYEKCKKCQLPEKFDRISTKLSIIDFKSEPWKYEVQVLCDGKVIARVPVDN